MLPFGFGGPALLLQCLFTTLFTVQLGFVSGHVKPERTILRMFIFTFHDTIDTLFTVYSTGHRPTGHSTVTPGETRESDVYITT